jgi:hypothetical protein
MVAAFMVKKRKAKISTFYEDLKAGLEEILAYKEGKIELRSTVIEILEPPVACKTKNIKK